MRPLTPTYVMVHEQPIEEDVTLTQIAEWGETIIVRQHEYDWSDLVEVTIGVGNYPALRRTYVEDAGGQILTEVYYLIYDGHGFALQFSAHAKKYEKSQVIFDRMQTSLELFEPTPN